MKICGRCDEAIQPGQKYTSYSVPAASGAGATVYRHDQPCKPVPTQTSPIELPVSANGTTPTPG